jgi:predicted N-acetyltransferase YhbS
MSHSIAIRLCTTQSELAALYEQRWLVLRMPLGLERGTEKDEHDDRSIHAVAVCQTMTPHKIVGSARLRQLSETMGSLAYVAVLPDFQHQGIGSGLIQLLMTIAQAKGFQVLRVMSRVDAIEFYSRLGFIPQGTPQDYLGVPHQFMLYCLTEHS